MFKPDHLIQTQDKSFHTSLYNHGVLFYNESKVQMFSKKWKVVGTKSSENHFEKKYILFMLKSDFAFQSGPKIIGQITKSYHPQIHDNANTRDMKLHCVILE